MNTTNSSAWDWPFADDELDSSLDQSSFNSDVVVSDMAAQGYGSLDIADAFRQLGGTAVQLMQAMKAHAFSNLETARAVKHRATTCPHDGGGTSGRYPRTRAVVHR